MASINKGEYGQALRVNMGESVVSNVGLSFVMQPKIGATKTRVSGVTVGMVNAIEGDQTFKAEQYLEYVIQPEDFDYPGQWRMRGEVNLDASTKLIGDFAIFEVLD